MCIYARPVPDAKNAHMSKVKNDQGVVYLDFFQCAGQGLAKPSLG